MDSEMYKIATTIESDTFNLGEGMFVFDYIPSPSFTHTTGMTHFLDF